MRAIRNTIAFIFGFSLMAGCAALMSPDAHAALDSAAWANGMDTYTLETNSIIVTSTLGVAFCLGWVAGSFR